MIYEHIARLSSSDLQANFTDIVLRSSTDSDYQEWSAAFDDSLARKYVLPQKCCQLSKHFVPITSG